MSLHACFAHHQTCAACVRVCVKCVFQDLKLCLHLFFNLSFASLINFQSVSKLLHTFIYECLVLRPACCCMLLS